MKKRHLAVLAAAASAGYLAVINKKKIWDHMFEQFMSRLPGNSSEYDPDQISFNEENELKQESAQVENE